jgi:hypothetical protein
MRRVALIYGEGRVLPEAKHVWGLRLAGAAVRLVMLGPSAPCGSAPAV